MSNIKKLGNFIGEDFDLTNKLFKGSAVLRRTKLSEAPYISRSHENEGSYEITLTKEEANQYEYDKFVSALRSTKRSHPDIVIPTIDEFINRKYETGRKLGKQLAKDGCPSWLIDELSAIEIQEEYTVTLTISGAPQFMIGVSAFSNDRWDSYSGSSCLDVTKDEGNQIHVLGLLSSSRFFVAFTHDNVDQLSDMDNNPRIMETRVLMFVDDEGDLHFNSKAYGSNNKDKNMIKQALKNSGLAKGVLGVTIDEDYIYQNTSEESGVDRDTIEYLENISKDNMDLKAKVFSNVFTPLEVYVHGAYKMDLGNAKKIEQLSRNLTKCHCPSCRPFIDGEVQERDTMVVTFVDYRHDDHGEIQGIELDLKEYCPACDNDREITVTEYNGWGDTSYWTNITGTWGDSVNVLGYNEEREYYTFRSDLLVDCGDSENASQKMLRTYSLYDEGSFHTNEEDFILIYDAKQDLVKEYKENINQMLF